MREEAKCSPLTFVLAITVACFSIAFLINWQNRDANAKFKEEQVGAYDAFYSDCIDYFDNNENVTIYKVEETCKSLEKYSKQESKQIIHDLENPPREYQSTKECGTRGCVYY